MTTEEISRSNFKECIPIRLKKPKDVNVTDVDLWQFADHTPNDIEIKHMWAETLALLVKLSMNNHIFMYGNEIIIQKNKGSIGVRLTGVLAELFMLIWCGELKEKLSHTGIVNRVLNRFVDDITNHPRRYEVDQWQNSFQGRKG